MQCPQAKTIPLRSSCLSERFECSHTRSGRNSLSQGLPASVRVYNVPKFDSPASQKNFFKGDKVQLKWNDNGTSLIVLAQTEVDKTGKSYYGETTMYLLSANGGFDSRVDLGMMSKSYPRAQCLPWVRQRRAYP